MRILPKPYLPVPPANYDQRYLAEVVRAYSILADQTRNPGEGRFTNIVLTDLPNSDYGLEPGSLFRDSSFVKVVLINQPNAIGSESSVSVGAVQVPQ